MTDKSNAADAANENSQTQTGAASANTGRTPIESLPVDVQAYIRELRGEAKMTREELSALKESAAAAERKRLEEQGQFKALYEKEVTEKERIAAEAKQSATYKDAFTKSLEDRIKAIPEVMRPLVPEGMEPLALSAWLDKNAALLSNRKAPNLDAGAGSGNGSSGADKGATPTRLDIEMAANFRIPVAEYMKQKAAMERERANPPFNEE